jgi:hypothetical protein
MDLRKAVILVVWFFGRLDSISPSGHAIRQAAARDTLRSEGWPPHSANSRKLQDLRDLPEE